MNIRPPDVSPLRMRPPTLITKTETEKMDVLLYRYGPGTTPEKYQYGGANQVVEHKSLRMYDEVVPDFKRRQAAGDLFFNTMYTVEEELKRPLTLLRGTSNKYGLQTIDATCAFPIHNRKLNYSDISFKFIQDAAITDAYAKVSANEGDTLLWLGEFKETMSMFFDIGKGIRRLVEMTKAKRTKWAKGKLSVEEAQQLTLQLLFGILPLEQAAAQFMEGLFKIKDPLSRETARGKRVKVASDSQMTFQKNHGTGRTMSVDLRTISAESLTVTCRAGVLYEIDTLNVPWISIILDPKSVVSTTYALARLSFVIDWLINVGSTLAAWSPSVGTKELGAWTTVTVEHEHLGKFIAEPNGINPVGQSDWSWIQRQKWRVPIDRGDLPVLPRLDINLDVSKVLSMVLLFAKIRKTI